MKKLLPVVVLIALASAADLSPNVMDALTTIDSVPTQQQLDTALMLPPQGAQSSLITIAQDDSQNVGVRLRAIHALGKYCLVQQPGAKCDGTDPAHVALTTLITDYAAEHTGAGVLLLRAAIETLGPLQVQTDLVQLQPLLDHSSRDIRTATAHALRDLCNVDAIPPLRVRYQIEPTDQVKLAISEALRILPCLSL